MVPEDTHGTLNQYFLSLPPPSNPCNHKKVIVCRITFWCKLLQYTYKTPPVKAFTNYFNCIFIVCSINCTVFVLNFERIQKRKNTTCVLMQYMLVNRIEQLEIRYWFVYEKYQKNGEDSCTWEYTQNCKSSFAFSLYLSVKRLCNFNFVGQT